MTIDRKKLVELLVEKTGLDEKQVEEQLSELITRIQKAAEEGKSFEIEGFGTFRIKDDELHFEPTDQLETEVNHKYAGMEPIELIGAYKDKESDADAEVPEAEAEQEEDAAEPPTEKKKEDIWGFDAEAAEEPSPEKEDQEEIVEEPAGQEQASEVPKEEPGETTQDEETEMPEPPVQEKDEEESPLEETEKEPAMELEQEKEEEAEADEQEPVEEKTSKWAPADELKTKPWKKPEKKKDPIGTIMVAVVVVIAVGIGGWLVYDMGLLDGIFGSSENSGQQVASTTQRPQVTHPDPENGGEKPEQSQSGQQEDQQPPQGQQPVTSEPEAEKEVAESTGQEQASAEAPLYGLMGETNPDANDGYTIVVYSLTNRSKARDLHNQLSDEGYRTVLMDATVDENEFWRVGLGQFETVRDAQQAAGDLKPPFNNNFFIKRIQ